MNYCNPEGFRNEVKELLARGDIDAFFNWFDGGKTTLGAFQKGADVFNRVIFPYAEKYLKKKKNLVAMDLGYGGGSKIQAALDHFKIVYGVDVHGEQQFVLSRLQVPEGKEVRLLQTDGTSISVTPNQIDFLYSWVVFCHLGTIENVKSYMAETYRVLKPGGIAVIFFTRLIRSKKRQTWKEVKTDMVQELKHDPGYREGGPESKVRTINLVVSMHIMEDLAEAANLQVLDRMASWDETPQGTVFHGQYGLVLGKAPKKPKEPKEPKKPKKATLKRR